MLATFLDGHSDLVTVCLTLVAIVAIIAIVKLIVFLVSKF